MANLLNDLTRAGLYELLRMRMVRQIPIASPAVGTDFTTVIGAGVYWELLAAHYRFAASAVVANRFPGLLVSDPDGVELYRLGPNNTVTASATVSTSLLAGLGYQVTGGTTISGLPTPPLLLIAGSTVRSSTGGLDAGDQYTQVILFVREWSAQQIAVQAQWLARQLPSTVLLDQGGS